MKRRLNRGANLRGYSLIELMIVIGMIALLSVMVVIGIGKLQVNSKRQQTALILENLRAMYADFDTVNRLHFPSSALPCPMNVTLDANPSNGMGPANDATQLNRYGAAVWCTRDMMALLRQTPSNATAIGKLPASSIMLMPAGFNSAYPSPYAATIGAWSAATNYAPLSYANDSNNANNPAVCSMQYTDPITGQQSYAYYRALQFTGTANPIQPPNTLFWMPMTFDDTVPIPLDAWGNPIIFVAGGTLASPYNAATDNALVPGSGLLVAGGRPFQMTSPDGRPFFASAGPDGDFSKGDDNIYSFEK